MGRTLGSISLLDLQTIAFSLGHDYLPYPFRFTAPSRFSQAAELQVYRADVLSRFREGEYDHLRQWLEIQLDKAEIRVEFLYLDPQMTPTVRASATRFHDIGFVALQDDGDMITVRQISAYDVGPEVAELAELSGKPGRHEKAIFPSLGMRGPSSVVAAADDGVILDRVVLGGSIARIPADNLLAGGTIQTAFRPARRWGRDRDKNVIGWVSTSQGDYVLESPYEHAVPVTRSKLVERINRSIAGDIAEIRRLRDG